MHIDNITPEQAIKEFTPFKGHLPKTLERYRKRIVDFDYDGETYQAWMVSGWRREDDLVHTIIGDTVAEVAEGLKYAVPCGCANCEHYKEIALKYKPVFVTTIEAAQMLNVKPSRIRQLAIAGRLRGTKFGRDWGIELSDINRFKKEDRDRRRGNNGA
jgi:excisionase family DNA binding protein